MSSLGKVFLGDSERRDPFRYWPHDYQGTRRGNLEVQERSQIYYRIGLLEGWWCRYVVDHLRTVEINLTLMQVST